MEFTPSDWNKIHNLSAQQLADCPWPIAGSHCSPCTIYRPDSYHTMLAVWGEFSGDASRKRYYAQTGCTDYSPIMRFACKVGRFRTTAVPTDDGLFIGLVTQEVLNDTNKLYDPSQWQWAGYLATLPGGTPTVPYWICADVNLAWTTTPLFLFMCTNGSYEVCGWDMVGYNDTIFPQDGLLLNEYNYNEPTHANGWTAMDNRYRGAFHIYSPPAGQLIEGHSHIVSPIFTTTATEGTPYNFSFTQTNENAFPCGCPETMVWRLYNRDTSQPIMDEATYTLDCGYTGASGVGGSITFSGGGTFHGQLKAGHKEGTTTVYDSIYDFDITVTALPCTNWTTEIICEQHGCYWWNGSCHSSQPTQCSDLNNQTECLAYSCYWYDNSCHSTPQQTGICQWVTAKGGAAGLDVSEVFQIIDSYVLQTPPTGYTFVPTITQVMGIIDYYLGFIDSGNQKTGCSF